MLTQHIEASNIKVNNNVLKILLTQQLLQCVKVNIIDCCYKQAKTVYDDTVNRQANAQYDDNS